MGSSWGPLGPRRPQGPIGGLCMNGLDPGGRHGCEGTIKTMLKCRNESMQMQRRAWKSIFSVVRAVTTAPCRPGEIKVNLITTTDAVLLTGTLSPSLPPTKGFLDKDERIESLAAANS